MGGDIARRIAFWMGAHHDSAAAAAAGKVGDHNEQTQTDTNGHEARRGDTPRQPGRFMNVEDCAAHIGRTVIAVRRLVAKGQIPTIRVGRRVQFDREKIDRWMERHARRGQQVDE